MNDFLVKDVLIVDGTGAAPSHGDVAIQDGRITSVGPNRDSAREAP